LDDIGKMFKTQVCGTTSIASGFTEKFQTFFDFTHYLELIKILNFCLSKYVTA